jgi:hypothetical protein
VALSDEPVLLEILSAIEFLLGSISSAISGTEATSP